MNSCSAFETRRRDAGFSSISLARLGVKFRLCRRSWSLGEPESQIIEILDVLCPAGAARSSAVRRLTGSLNLPSLLS